MLDWSKISTVLLDMDGTILDLHFDNHFWLHHLPLRYSETAKISLEQAQVSLKEGYEKVVGTIDWYCLDYWAEQTKLPIKELKKEIQHLINLRSDAHDFMLALRESGRRIILVTNAHPDSLSLKIEQTQLDKYFDYVWRQISKDDRFSLFLQIPRQSQTSDLFLLNRHQLKEPLVSLILYLSPLRSH